MVSREALLVAALLHDMGRFEFGPADGQTLHTAYGGSFVDEYLARFRCLEPILAEVSGLVAHSDQGSDNSVLWEANQLAAPAQQVDGRPETPRSLMSILTTVDVGKGALPPLAHRYMPGPVDFANPFPERTSVKAAEWLGWEQPKDEHSRAWQQLCGDIRAIPADLDLTSWIETFLGVARKHLCRMASPGARSHPDVSLYDRARSMAAIALCLREAQQEPAPFLLIRGDISGIQAFLYKLASPDEEGGTKNIAKRLRGRSLFLVLLAETVALHYLRALDLPPTNLLYSGGGHFLILAPHTAAVKDKWKQAEEKVNRWLIDQHRGELALVSVATPAERPLMDDFSRLMQCSSSELERAKRQKFRSVLDAGLFELPDYPQTMDVCPVCQADFVKDSRPTCRACAGHVETGRRIVRAQYLVRFEGDDAGGEFADLGFAWKLADDWTEVSRLVASTQADRVHVERFNNSDFLPSVGMAPENPNLSFGFRPLGQYAPVDEEDGGPLDFKLLAGLNAAAYPLLGVVRLDVDSLGAIFASGLSLPQTTALSREMETFFSGYVNTLAQEHEMYITYAGGDDLFAVGSWINAIEFGRALRQDFDRFSGGNPNLTFSGGVLFCKPDFPIGRAAQATGKLEKRAKDAEGKNAACLFDEVVSWDRLEELLEFGRDLLYLVTEAHPDCRLPRSFVHRLLNLATERRIAREKGNLQAEIQTQMHLKYLVARRGATSEAINAQQEMGEDRRKVGLLGRLVTEPELMRQIVVPASYVLYKTRHLNRE